MGADRVQPGSHRVDIVVQERVDIAGRGLFAFLQAGMREPVDLRARQNRAFPLG
jgi:hypothetical protein